jgi:hypothetical protein
VITRSPQIRRNMVANTYCQSTSSPTGCIRRLCQLVMILEHGTESWLQPSCASDHGDCEADNCEPTRILTLFKAYSFGDRFLAPVFRRRVNEGLVSRARHPYWHPITSSMLQTGHLSIFLLITTYYSCWSTASALIGEARMYMVAKPLL